MGILHTLPDVGHIFHHYQREWMAWDPGTYSKDIVRVFYASYATTLQGSIHKNARTTTQAPLTAILLCMF